MGGRAVALSFVVVTLACLVGCSGEVSVDEKLVDTFVELRVVEATYGASSTVARMARQNILKRQGYTREEFLKKVDEVLDDEIMWVPFQKAVVARIDTLLSDNKSVSPSVPTPGAPQKKVPSRKGGVQ